MMDVRRSVFNLGTAALGSRLSALGLLVLAATTAFAQGPDEGMIRAARTRYNQAIARHDTAAIAMVLLPEVVQVTSTNAVSTSRDSTLARMAGLFASRPDVVYVRMPERIDVNTAWGQAAEEGAWTGRWTQADGVTRVGGRYFAKWRKVGGRWLLLSEVFVQTSCFGTSYCEAK
jgi:ketosteroid isomerase-like protein